MNFTDGFTDEKTPSKKLSSVICGVSVSPSITILPMDLLMAKAPKKIYSLYSVSISIGEYNISPTEKLYLYVISSVIFFVHR
jgi:hypothetical protein